VLAVIAVVRLLRRKAEKRAGDPIDQSEQIGVRAGFVGRLSAHEPAALETDDGDRVGSDRVIGLRPRGHGADRRWV
jgi:hypothetical protein